jgi:hypothetical protein
MLLSLLVLGVISPVHGLEFVILSLSAAREDRVHAQANGRCGAGCEANRVPNYGGWSIRLPKDLGLGATSPDREL